MIKAFLSITLFIVFIVLGLIHFSWALGGKWGFDNSLPTKENGERFLNPKKIDSAIVGFGLTLFALMYLLKSGFINFQISSWIIVYGSWIIPAIFIFRAIGDFKYVGFFKKIKNTEFGKIDSKLFSPLCLIIGSLGLIIQLIK